MNEVKAALTLKSPVGPKWMQRVISDAATLCLFVMGRIELSDADADALCLRLSQFCARVAARVPSPQGEAHASTFSQSPKAEVHEGQD